MRGVWIVCTKSPPPHTPSHTPPHPLFHPPHTFPPTPPPHPPPPIPPRCGGDDFVRYMGVCHTGKCCRAPLLIETKTAEAAVQAVQAIEAQLTPAETAVEVAENEVCGGAN